MRKTSDLFSCCRIAFTGVVLSSLVALIYSNTLSSPWQLDDYDNIVFNKNIQPSEFGIQSLTSLFYSTLAEGRINRPLSYLSFALNWHFGKTDPTGYHIVNIAIHIVTGVLLYLTTLSLFRTPRLSGLADHHVHLIGFLSAALWAFNPIQTQAVTYIVQRMASFAAMFYIAGLYCYLRFRLTSMRREKVLWVTGTLLAFVLGCGTKENAMTLPFALVLVELVFLREVGRVSWKAPWVWLGAAGGIILFFGVGSLVFLRGDPASILSYGGRYFTPGQRVLTEFRILIHYLSQIFYPVPTRLSLEHDIVVSTTPADPWTTLPSIIAVIGLVALALLRRGRWPLFSFAVLFFFLNHAIESSVIGLELIFEHRNYLPSMFLFLPAAQGLDQALEYYRGRSRPMRWVIAGFITLILIGFGAGTYLRNQVWQSGKSLWEDAALKAPASSRALHNLALTYYEPKGQYDHALELYRAALSLDKTNNSQESLIYNNIANLYYMKQDYQNAAFFWGKAAESYPAYGETRYRMALALARSGEDEAAVRQLTEALNRRPGHAAALKLKGIVLARLNRTDESLECFRQVLKSKPNDYAALINIGSVFFKIGRYEKAERFFRIARHRFAGENISLLWMAFLRLGLGDESGADALIDDLSKTMKLEALLAWMSNSDRFNLFSEGINLPEPRDVLRDRIAERLQGRVGEISALQ